MVPADDFPRKIYSLLAVAGVGHSVATLRQTVGLDQSVERGHSEVLERQKYVDERIDRLVGAIGELAHRQK